MNFDMSEENLLSPILNIKGDKTDLNFDSNYQQNLDNYKISMNSLVDENNILKQKIQEKDRM